MLSRSTIQLLRFPFSYFLMPVYWFALSTVPHINPLRAILIFIILHLLLYPASNGYNSFMDKDESSIGGIENPLRPTKQLFYTTFIMDLIALLLSLFVSILFAAGCLFYIICSRLYSYRGIRLKRFPVIGYLTVILNQGALIFWMVYYGSSSQFNVHPPLHCLVAATFLIGGFYPVTQIYQHKADAKDGVKTISMKLGIRGTFIFCAILYAIAFGLLFDYYFKLQRLHDFMLLVIFFIPVIFIFMRWVLEVWKNENAVNFQQTMQMNKIAGICTNLAFITLLIIHQFG